MNTSARQAESGSAVELTIEARPENLAIARLAVAGVATVAGASPEAIADLKLAVTEACTNAIQHAYGGDPGGEIAVRFAVGEGVVSVEVEDQGAGFEPGTASAAPVEQDGRGRGLGLSIIRMLSDELTIDSASSGTRVAFLKRITPPGA